VVKKSGKKIGNKVLPGVCGKKRVLWKSLAREVGGGFCPKQNARSFAPKNGAQDDKMKTGSAEQEARNG